MSALRDLNVYTQRSMYKYFFFFLYIEVMYILYKVYKRMKIMIREWRYVYFCIFRVEEKNIVKLRILVRVLKVETKIIGIIYIGKV